MTEPKKNYVPVCILESDRGHLMINEEGVVILVAIDLQTGKEAHVMISSSSKDSEGFIEAMQHMIDHQNHEEDPEEKAPDLEASNTSFEDMMKDIKKLH